MEILKRNKTYILLIFILILGAFLRFYKLDWGNGLFTHPDEYHIVASVNQLSFPTQMHPHFFSYGTVTIYLIYFTQELLNGISKTLNFQLSTFNSFLLGRFYSALFSTLTIFIAYKICRTFLGTKFSLIAALLVALTPGLIQQAHFATPESVQIFFLFGSLFFMLKFIKLRKIIYSVLASIFLGIALGVKISSIVFLLPIVISIILRTYFKRHSGLSRISNHFGDSGCAAAYQNDDEIRSFRKLFRLSILILTSLIVTIITFALTAPFVFLDYSAFRSNLDYEGGLALGKIPVFYTRQFINTTPALFQLEKILPYALGPALLVLGVLGFFLIVAIHLGWWQAESKRSHDSSEVDGHLRGVHSATSKVFIIITIAFLSLFLSNAFLFAKWTRFIASTFPFFAIFAVTFLDYLALKTKKLSYILGIVLVSTTILWLLAFFSIYLRNDIRIEASIWLEANSSPDSKFLVEGGNMIDLPLNGSFPRTSLDFYNLEENPSVRVKIADALYSSDYFLVQSRRVFMNHQRLRHLYPKTARFYDALFNGGLGFEQIKEFHSYPKLSLPGLTIEFPDEKAEETWSVFDHPVIRVFKKSKQLLKEEYARFLEN